MKVEEVLRVERIPRFQIRRRWRLALIGLGGIAQSAHLPAYRKGQRMGLPIEVVAAAEVDEKRREQGRLVWGIPKVYSDFREMLEKERPDVVDITLHWQRHREAKLEAVLLAAELGCHILVQKPMASTWEECLTMVERANREGVLMAVNQNARFAPTFFASRKLVEAGAVGEPFALVLKSDFPNQYPEMVHDFCVHTFDLMRWLLGSTPKLVTAVAKRDENFRWFVTFIARYPNGAVATAIDTSCAPFATSWSCEVHGTEGSLFGSEIYDDALSMNPSVVRWVSRGGDEVLLRRSYRYVPDAFLWSLCDLLEAAEQGRKPLCSGDDNLETMRLLFEAKVMLDLST